MVVPCTPFGVCTSLSLCHLCVALLLPLPIGWVLDIASSLQRLWLTGLIFTELVEKIIVTSYDAAFDYITKL